jgi:uracil-DNA glycosylase family 4
VLYAGLSRHGFARGTFAARADDGLTLDGACVSNAVKCVPPENKPLPEEIKTCNRFLAADIAGLGRLRAILALGRIAHDAVLRALGIPLSRLPFAHGARHELPEKRVLYDSYHCSRYNVNTGRLTPSMFDAVLARIARELPRC